MASILPRKSGRTRRRSVVSSLSSSSTSGSHKQATRIEINGRDDIFSVAFHPDCKHIVGGGDERKVRHWRAEDGKEVGTPIDVGGTVCNIAVSQNGNWVVSGTTTGLVTVWNTESYEKVIAFKGHDKSVCAVDFSPDGTKITTGSADSTARVWSFSTGNLASERLLNYLQHNGTVSAVKFSPNGHLIATATWECDSVRVYDYENGLILVDVPIKVSSLWNQSLAWASDGKQLFTLSHDSNISCIDVSKGMARSRWSIHSNDEPRCIALANNGAFIVASANSWISFWDTTTHKQFGTTFKHTARIQSMAIGANYGLALGGGQTITVRSLCDILPPPYSDAILVERDRWRIGAEKADLEKIVVSLRAQKESSDSEIARLHDQLCDSQRGLNETIESLRTQEKNSKDELARVQEIAKQLRNQLSNREDSLNETVDLYSKITQLEETVRQLHTDNTRSHQRADGLAQIIRAHERKDECETLYDEGRVIDAAICLFTIMNTASENKCISTLEMCGDEASSAEKRDEAIAAYSTALLLRPSNPDTLLVNLKPHIGIIPSDQFEIPNLAIYRAICNVLEEVGRIAEAVKCFQQLQSELGEDMGHRNVQAQCERDDGSQPQRNDATGSVHTTMNILEQETEPIDEPEWVADFKARCFETSKQCGDDAMHTALYKDADVHYTTALSLEPSSTDLLTKRSEARAAIGSWQDSLKDADAAIKLDPSYPRGYERKHAALLGAHRYDEAIIAYNDMLLMLEKSPDPSTRGKYLLDRIEASSEHLRLADLRKRYVSPSQTMAAIRNSVKRTQRDAPLVLISTGTGRLCDKHERLNEFEGDPIFKELVASMTTRLDDFRITQTVRQFFRYGTFSHTWEGAEPLFNDVLHDSVNQLAASPPVLKLMMFCMMVRDAGLRWAWSDTCCINKADGSALQESLTSMFQWYHESALTIVHLKGVRSDSDLGALEKSFWNTRAWTLQEFFASRIIRFYTEDWKPYFPRESVYNHKDSSAIMGEMAAANGVDVQALLSLKPGSENVRQKLCLAATRTATKPEDTSYSLFGIFDVSIPVTYGEGHQRALGRLLQEVLTRSGDVTILAWTGRASDYNSCLPADIGVYREPSSPHIPSLIADDEMDRLVAELRTTPYHDSAMMLYDQLALLQSPRLASRRLSLSCIMFPVRSLSTSSRDSQHVYRAVTSALGNAEIKTTEDLSSMKNLVFVHPWLKCLLDPALPSEGPGYRR
ncbi:hypothetical protein J3R82DRAFT_6127 [Butyriboletus roseoflavus]|nr:hypothetical protein J3R82DRAFT_6127 [Butyriboletus roseoflavus]